MTKTLRGIALRFFKTNKFITWTSVFSTILSVCLVIVMVSYATNAERSLREEVQKMYGEMDLSVGYEAKLNKSVNQELINSFRSNKDIDMLSPVIITHLKVDALQGEIYSVGVENDNLAKSRYHFKQNLQENSVIMNKSLAETLRLGIGQKVSIEDNEFIVSEIIEDLNASGLTPDILLLLNKQCKN
ncbi:ABC transporter permease [Niallia circulans]